MIAGRWIRNLFDPESEELILFGGNLNDLSLNILFLNMDGTLNREVKLAEGILEPDNGKIIRDIVMAILVYWYWNNDSYFANIDGMGNLVAERKFENRIS